jgi:hypothetical protein
MQTVKNKTLMSRTHKTIIFLFINGLLFFSDFYHIFRSIGSGNIRAECSMERGQRAKRSLEGNPHKGFPPRVSDRTHKFQFLGHHGNGDADDFSSCL